MPRPGAIESPGHQMHSAAPSRKNRYLPALFFWMILSGDPVQAGGHGFNAGACFTPTHQDPSPIVDRNTSTDCLAAHHSGVPDPIASSILITVATDFERAQLSDELLTGHENVPTRQTQPVQVASSQSTSEAAQDASVAGDWLFVDDASLAATRGGFDLGGGMSISFGLTRMVTVNGDLVTSTSIQIPDLSRLTNAQSAMLASQFGAVRIVQNGMIATADNARLPGAPGTTLIQNSLDNQMIKSRTVLDVNVGSLGILKAFNTQSAIRDAVINALSSR